MRATKSTLHLETTKRVFSGALGLIRRLYKSSVILEESTRTIELTALIAAAKTAHRINPEINGEKESLTMSMKTSSGLSRPIV